MALRDQKEFTNTAQFETDTDEASPVNETIDRNAAAQVAATKALAKAATTSTAVAMPAKRIVFVKSFDDQKDVFDTATVSALSLATPRITAEQGALRKNRLTKLGTSVVLDVISWNFRWALGCGEDKMNDEMKQLYRVSYDNKVVDGDGCSVGEYINSLKAQGYTKAKSQPYGDLFGYIVSVDGKEIPVDDRELTLIQMAPTTLGNFTTFCASRGILESRGEVTASTFIEVLAQDQSKGDKSYTNMTFKAVKAVKS